MNDDDLVERILRGLAITREQYDKRAAERVVLLPAEVRERQVATLRRQAETFSVGSVERARLLALAEVEQGGNDAE